MTATERRARFRAKMAGAGLIQINVWVPPHAAADIQRAAELIRENPDLTVARLVSGATGKMIGLKAKRAVSEQRKIENKWNLA